MALLNIWESQRNEVFSMLEGLKDIPNVFADSDDPSHQWKVLIYDTKGQRVLSTLVKVGALRLKGVTLHLSLLNKDRSGVPEVPAVYFCEPSEENLERIHHDLSTLLTTNGKSLPMHVGFRFNFLSRIETPQLQRLASVATQAGTAQLVESVVDRYLDFVSLNPTEFELGMSKTFEVLSGNNDNAITSQLNQIVFGLLSVCMTLKIMPVIRCSSSQTLPSRMIASMLAVELKKCYDQGIFKGSAPKGHAAITNRPCLMILDRIVDLSIPFEHSWTYRALVKDSLALDANRVTFEMKDKNGDLTKVSHDLDSSDNYWDQWCELSFPDLLGSVNTAVQAYDEEMKSFASKEALEVNALTSALSSLPVMTERKRLLDLHTNLNTVLLEIVNERSIDQFYALEEGVLVGTTPVATCIKTFRDMCQKNVGTLTDRWRTALCICGSRLPTTDKKEFLQEIKSLIARCRPNAIELLELIIKKSDKGNAIFSKDESATLQLQTPFGGAFGGAMAEAEKVFSSQTEELMQGKLGQIGKGLLNQGKGFVMQGMKAMIGMQRTTPVAEIVKDLMSGRSDSSILTLDPLQMSMDGKPVPLNMIPGAFSKGIVFIAGEGSLLESQALRQSLQRVSMSSSSAGINRSTNKVGANPKSTLYAGGSVVYGCTSFESPDEFCKMIDTLNL